MIFQDLNNDVIADHVEDWIKDKANSIFIKYSVFALYLLQLLF